MFRIFILLTLFIPEIVFAQKIIHAIKRDYQTNKITYEDYLVNKALAIYKPELLPAHYIDESDGLPVKCATFLSFEVKKNWDLLSPANQRLLKKFMFRPSGLTDSYISPSRKFKIHYTTKEGDWNAVSTVDNDNNSIPDYVDAAAEFFDYSYSYQVDNLGYNPPPSDKGEDGDEYDIYIIGEANGLYGETFFESTVGSSNKYISYITVDNDYSGSKYNSKGLDGLRVTAAHEFFHAIQGGYKITFNNDFFEQEAFFYEISSTWMEDMVFNDVNDYSHYNVIERNNADNDTIGYMYTFFRQKNRMIFTTYNQRHEYGNCLWNHMLAKKYGHQIIREIWEKMEDRLALDAMDYVFHKYNSSFNIEFADYSVWNYFTGSRADTVNYYPEGADYPQVTYMDKIRFISDITYRNECNQLSFNYVNFYDIYTKNHITLIPVNFEYSNESNNSSPFKFELSHSGPNFLVKVSKDVIDNYNIWAFNAIILDQMKNISIVPFDENGFIVTDGVEIKSSTKILGVGPNPFIISKDLRFYVYYQLKKVYPVKISIFTENGRKIDEINLPGIKNSYSWDKESFEKLNIGSGIYILILEADGVIDIAKFAVIN